MKINVERLYPYPVLAEGRDDYKTGTFRAKVTCQIDVADNLVLNADFSTDCAEMQKLIDTGAAKYLLHVECPLTFYRKIFVSADGKFPCKIPLERVKKNLDCLALIYLTRDVENFFCGDWNEDFAGLTFNLKKGSILAYQNFEPLKLPDDPNIFTNVASIFNIHGQSDDDSFQVDPTQSRIKIGLNHGDYLLYRKYCSLPEFQPILNAMIIPALPLHRQSENPQRHREILQVLQRQQRETRCLEGELATRDIRTQ